MNILYDINKNGYSKQKGRVCIVQICLWVLRFWSWFIKSLFFWFIYLFFCILIMNYLRIFQRNKIRTKRMYLYIPVSLSNAYISLCFPTGLDEFSQCCLQYLQNAKLHVWLSVICSLLPHDYCYMNSWFLAWLSTLLWTDQWG